MGGDERVVLEEGVRAGTARRNWPSGLRKRVRRSDHEAEEEGGDEEQDGRRPTNNGVAQASSVDEDDRPHHQAEEHRPQQDRSLEVGPHARQVVEERRGASVVVRHVLQGVVVGDEGVLHGNEGHDPGGGDHGHHRDWRRRPALARPEELHGEQHAAEQRSSEGHRHRYLPNGTVHALAASVITGRCRSTPALDPGGQRCTTPSVSPESGRIRRWSTSWRRSVR